jgi:folate-binding protein YgfZ
MINPDYQNATTGAALFDRSSCGKVEVSGKDAPSFLHNLCSNDIVNMPLGAGCEAFFCTIRAKVVAYVFIYHVRLAGGQDAFWIDTVPGGNEKLVAHLNRYIIAEQVEVADRTAEFAQFHLAGPNAKAVLARALADDVPDLEQHQHMERTFGVSVHSNIRRNDVLGVPGFDIVCLKPLAGGLTRMLTDSGAKLAGPEAYELLRIEAGMPEYGKDIDEDRFAFDVGRTAQAISYNKGCYLGQEPIVMARDRAGHAPRTLLGLELAGNAPAPPRAKVFHAGEEVGFVTSSVNSPKMARAIALAYLRYGHQTPGTVMEVETTTGRVAAEVSGLPFA